jgi:uncharacterized membrane protein
MSTLRWFGELAAAILLLAHLGWLLLTWDSLPARIPRHFGLSGRPDAWAEDPNVLLILAATSAGLYLLLTLIPRFPSLANLSVQLTDANRDRQFRLLGEFLAVLKTFLLGNFFAINMLTVAVGRGEMDGLGAWFLPITMGATLACVAVYLRLAHRYA